MGQQPDVSQVIAGPALVLVAPVGTALPSLATLPIVWPGTWSATGYTDAGVDFAYNPTIKEEYVDEEAAVVFDILEKEEAQIQCHMAESDLENLLLAISAATQSGQAISVGSLPLNYYAVAVVGPAPNGNSRVISFQKAISKAATSLKFTRKAKQVIPITWAARKIANQNLFTLTDVGTGYENS